MTPSMMLAAAALAAQADTGSDLVSRSIDHDGRTRTWSEYIPAQCVRPAKPCMTVLMLHGGMPSQLRRLLEGRGLRTEGRHEQIARGVGLLDAAKRESFILLVPRAVDGNWNDGRPEIADEVDDVGFVRAMLADVGKRGTVAAARTFSAGVSNGGMMSFRLACEASDLIRGIGAVVANMSNALAQKCPKGRPVDIVQVLGQADQLMKYEGGQIGRNRGGTMSASDSLAFWGARLPNPVASQRKLNQEVTLRTLSSSAGRIAQYSLQSYGHGWPGADETQGDRPARRLRGGAGGLQNIRGSNPTDFDATRVIIDFFKAVPPR